jgi:DNA-binding CsgD family transcriptional regulator
MANRVRVRVGVFDENEIFRRGVAACLAEDHAIEVVARGATANGPVGLDVAIVSARVAAAELLDCPLVVCRADGGARADDSGNRVAAVLPRGALTAKQLTVTVMAAAAGLCVGAPALERRAAAPALDDRSVQVLRLLADGAGTQEISVSLSYSERTIKGLIGEIRRTLGARSRAQAVARGIRSGII